MTINKGFKDIKELDRQKAEAKPQVKPESSPQPKFKGQALSKAQEIAQELGQSQIALAKAAATSGKQRGALLAKTSIQAEQLTRAAIEAAATKKNLEDMQRVNEIQCGLIEATLDEDFIEGVLLEANEFIEGNSHPLLLGS